MAEKDRMSVAAFDQAAAMVGDSFPKVWRRLFDGCMEAGFSEDDSMDLLKTFILSQGTYPKG